MSAPPRSLLPLQVAGAWIAVDARRVVEILGPSAITVIPGTPRIVPGVVAFRGRAIAVIDVASLVGSAEGARGEPRARTVVVEMGASTIALPADAVREVIEVAGDELAPPLASEPWSDARVMVLGALAPVLDVSRAMPVIAPA